MVLCFDASLCHFLTLVVLFFVFFWSSLQCAHAGCLMELCIQLCITMLGKQLIQNNLFEIGIPWVLMYLRRTEHNLNSRPTGHTVCGFNKSQNTLSPPTQLCLYLRGVRSTSVWCSGSYMGKKTLCRTLCSLQFIFIYFLMSRQYSCMKVQCTVWCFWYMYPPSFKKSLTLNTVMPGNL